MKFLHVAISTAVMLIATSSHALETIDLDVPGNLAAIERDHPDQFAKIQRILAEVRRRPGSVDTWMRTEFQARNIEYTDLIMATNPAKKRLGFTLGDTAYVKVIALEGYSAP
jgi:hypothetical protein